jgi:hypothetical protein
MRVSSATKNARRWMTRLLRRFRSERGAIRLGFGDVLTAAIVIAILYYAAYLQSAIYPRTSAPPAAPPAATAKK